MQIFVYVQSGLLSVDNSITATSVDNLSAAAGGEEEGLGMSSNGAN